MRLFRLLKIASVASRFGLDEMVLEHEPSGRLVRIANALQFWRNLSAPRAERLRLAIQAMPLHAGEQRVNISCSFGVSERGQHSSLEQLINATDQRLYSAKQGGRNRVCGEYSAQQYSASH